jgi:hypothetical protein
MLSVDDYVDTIRCIHVSSVGFVVLQLPRDAGSVKSRAGAYRHTRTISIRYTGIDGRSNQTEISKKLRPQVTNEFELDQI